MYRIQEWDTMKKQAQRSTENASHAYILWSDDNFYPWHVMAYRKTDSFKAHTVFRNQQDALIFFERISMA